MKISVVLPSLNPDEKLLMVVDGLIKEGFDDIIIVNDGSDEEHIAPFKQASEYKEVTVLTHEVTRGKGRALKTAFEYCINNRPDIAGVVTVDGANQHRPQDIKACCEKMKENPKKVILGCRDFSGEEVPWKSRFGNNVTKGVFKFACGIKISDTQTGLRAIPAKYLPLLSGVKGERFEYETRVLLEMKRRHIEFDEVKIETVYIEENATTHFRPIKDSIIIYAVIIKYLIGSVASFLIDIGLFTALQYLIGDRVSTSVNILISTIGARVISSLFNFFYNRNAVFESEESVGKTMLRYYILCVCQMGVSYGFVNLLAMLTGASKALTSVIKVLVDIILFILSFQIQRRWVFSSKKEEN